MLDREAFHGALIEPDAQRPAGDARGRPARRPHRRPRPRGVALDLIDTGCGMDERTRVARCSRRSSPPSRAARAWACRRRARSSKPTAAASAWRAKSAAARRFTIELPVPPRLGGRVSRAVLVRPYAAPLSTPAAGRGSVSSVAWPPKACRPPPAPAPPIQVLIVDNDAAHAEAVAESLERVGYDCTVATSGPQGLKLIEDEHVRHRHHRPDDERRRRPGRSWPRAKEKLPDAEVILVTGHGTIPSAVDGHAAGGVQLPAQAARPEPAAGRGRKGRRPACACGGTNAELQPPARREIRLRGGHRHQPADARRHRPAASGSPRPTPAC